MSSLLLVSSNPAHLSPLSRSQPQASTQHQCQPANDISIIPKPNSCCLPRLCARRDGTSLPKTPLSPPHSLLFQSSLPGTSNAYQAIPTSSTKTPGKKKCTTCPASAVEDGKRPCLYFPCSSCISPSYSSLLSLDITFIDPLLPPLPLSSSSSPPPSPPRLYRSLPKQPYSSQSPPQSFPTPHHCQATAQRCN